MGTKLVCEIKNTGKEYKKFLPMVYYIPFKSRSTLIYGKLFANSVKHGEIIEDKADSHKVIITDNPEYEKKELDKLLYSDIKTAVKGKKFKDLAENLSDNIAKRLLNRIMKFSKGQLETLSDFTVGGRLNAMGIFITYRLEE